MLRISEIRLDPEHSEQELLSALEERLSGSGAAIRSHTIVRRAVDARHRHRVVLVYIVDVAVDAEEEVLKKIDARNVAIAPQFGYEFKIAQAHRFSMRPVVIGFGPAGIFAALTLAERGARPIVLERGADVDERSKHVHDFVQSGAFLPESNILFGEGGAGTFSDGKLYTLINDVRTQKIFDEFVSAGAPRDILVNAKPHIGTDNLKKVVKTLREKITSLGGEVRFKSKVTGLIIKDDICSGVIINDFERIETDAVIVAIGASARDTTESLHHHGLTISQKPFSIGLRIEHPQEIVNQAQYGDFAFNPALGAAEYKLVHHSSRGRSAYTFCMCPGGLVVGASSEAGGVVTNGMSEYARDRENANSALVVGIDPKDFESDHPLAGIAFQRKWEQKAFDLGGRNYNAPVQLLADFMQGRPSNNFGTVRPTYKPGTAFADLNQCLPVYVSATIKEAVRAFDKKVRDFAMPDAVLTGVETRTSSAVRMERSAMFESNIANVYPIGEGAGYAGGIVSAAIDGIKVVEALLHVHV
jgi:uncharacterized protein